MVVDFPLKGMGFAISITCNLGSMGRPVKIAPMPLFKSGFGDTLTNLANAGYGLEKKEQAQVMAKLEKAGAAVRICLRTGFLTKFTKARFQMGLL
jgi:hypothetical protein